MRSYHPVPPQWDARARARSPSEPGQQTTQEDVDPEVLFYEFLEGLQLHKSVRIGGAICLQKERELSVMSGSRMRSAVVSPAAVVSSAAISASSVVLSYATNCGLTQHLAGQVILREIFVQVIEEPAFMIKGVVVNPWVPNSSGPTIGPREAGPWLVPPSCRWKDGTFEAFPGDALAQCYDAEALGNRDPTALQGHGTGEREKFAASRPDAWAVRGFGKARAGGKPSEIWQREGAFFRVLSSHQRVGRVVAITDVLLGHCGSQTRAAKLRGWRLRRFGNLGYVFEVALLAQLVCSGGMHCKFHRLEHDELELLRMNSTRL